MRVGNISNVSFGKVIAVSGDMETTKRFTDEISKTEGDYLILSATEIYKRNGEEKGLCSKAVQTGSEVTFVITGDEDVKKASMMLPGWGSVNGISKHLSKFFDLKNYDKALKGVIKEINASKPKAKKPKNRG